MYVYMFQVNSEIDVGVSAYSQLQKLKGQEIDATDSDKAKKNVCICMCCVVSSIDGTILDLNLSIYCLLYILIQ